MARTQFLYLLKNKMKFSLEFFWYKNLNLANFDNIFLEKRVKKPRQREDNVKVSKIHFYRWGTPCIFLLMGRRIIMKVPMLYFSFLCLKACIVISSYRKREGKKICGFYLKLSYKSISFHALGKDDDHCIECIPGFFKPSSAVPWVPPS